MSFTEDKVLLDEIWYEKKPMSEHISSYGGILYWDNASVADHASGMFKMVVNDPYKRSFGSMIDQIQSYCKIGLTNV